MISIGQPLNKFLCIDDSRHFSHVFFVHLPIPQPNIFFDVSGKKKGVLHYQPYLGSEVREVSFSNINPIEKNSTFLHFIESFEEVQQRGFSRSSSANNGYYLTFLDCERDIFKDFVLPIIGEGDMLEFDITLYLLSFWGGGP